MKKIKIIFSAVIIVAVLILHACTPKKEVSEEIKIETVVKEGAEAQSMAVIGIDGMTCAVGCAGFIEKKLSNLDGVLSAEVNFDENKANIQFDDSKISEKELISEISKLNDGQYKITTVAVEKTVKKTINTEGVKEAAKQVSFFKINADETEEESVSYTDGLKSLVFPNIFNWIKDITLPEN